jgi:hypothetical protein
MPEVHTMLCRYGVTLTLRQDGLYRIEGVPLSCDRLTINTLHPTGSLP